MPSRAPAEHCPSRVPANEYGIPWAAEHHCNAFILLGLGADWVRPLFGDRREPTSLIAEDAEIKAARKNLTPPPPRTAVQP